MSTAIRRIGYAALIMVAGGFAFVHLRGPNGLPALMEKRRVIRDLEEQNGALKADNERRRARNEDLKEKPDTWDLEIRKRTEKIKENETDFKLPPEPAKSTGEEIKPTTNADPSVAQ
jgi:cell division protein FtsB